MGSDPPTAAFGWVDAWRRLRRNRVALARAVGALPEMPKHVFVDGARVLGVVGTGDTIDVARDRGYGAAERITWPGVQYRRDIAD